MVWRVVLGTSLLWIASLAVADEPTFAPFPVDWQSPADSPAGVAFLLDPPAGHAGFVRAADGHLVRPDGKRFRIWGFNITAKACFPAKADAPLIAAHLARCGINCLRFHFLDNLSPGGLIDAGRDDTQAFDAGQFDRFDFFVNELKQRGIYADINLNVGRKYKPGDGVRDCELLGYAKAVTYFDPRLLQLQRDYARQLLTHRNPYTGHEYRHEPSVALVEMLNENSLVEAWFTGRLLGKQTKKPSGTWHDIPPSYEKDLTGRYQAWLGQQVSDGELATLRKAAGVAADAPLPRLKPAEFAAAPKERFQLEASFYMAIERTYFREMGRFLREEVGVKSLLLGTSDHSHGKSGYPLVSSTSQLDVVDGHVYWQHPRYIDDAANGRRIGFEIGNTPMVNDPLHSTPVQLSRTAVLGKPYTVSEVNHPFPAEYACEGVPILAAYAALQDWDGLFWYTLCHEPLPGAATKTGGHFDFAVDPVRMSQLAAGALMFVRGDVRAAPTTLPRTYSPEQVRESIRMGWSQSPYFTPGFPLSLPLVHGVRVASLDGPPTAPIDITPPEPIRSDTGELTWLLNSEKQGLVAVDTPRSQALVGFSRANPRELSNLAAQPDLPFCAITLSALDGRPIAASAKLLLTTTARSANTDMQWAANRKSLESWGKPPRQIEPVRGRVTLRNLDNAATVVAQPLDAVGRPLGKPLTAEKTAADWSIAIGEPATTWYLVEVKR